jgi:phytoene dehydrogenase-like protein
MVEHDVVIIGAGHNGLVAANYLADAGLDVLVVEANTRIGGMTASGCPIPDAPRHVVNYCSADLLFWMASPVAAELDLARYGLRTVPANPSYAYLHPDGASLAIWRDPRKTAEEIRHFSPSDAESYLDYARLLDGLFDLALPFMLANLRNPDWKAVSRLGRGALRHRGLLRQFGAFVLASGEEVIDERFHHPVVRAALHCVGAGANPISDNGTSVTHLLLGFLHRVGAVRPVGGMQAVPDALATRLQAVGGRVVTEAPVAEILVHSGRARGVALADGTVIQARRAVLATCDPRTALERLLPAGTLSPRLESRVRHIPANAGGAGQMKVDLALSGKVDLSRHRRWRTDGLDLRVPACLIGSPEGNRRAFARSSAGMLPDTDDIALWPVVTTALDPTQAPPGQDTLYLYCAAMPLQPEGGWKQREGEAADAIVRRAEQFYDGISAVEIGRWVETPEAMADRTGATNGAVLHADMTLLRSGPLRPALGFGGFRLPIDDLYIGGAGAHPGGGVTGLPGRLAAREILRRRSSRAR